jgi:bacteriocin-like protein
MNECSNWFSEVSINELQQIEGGGFWSDLAESIGRLAEGVGAVSGSPLLILVGGAMY